MSVKVNTMMKPYCQKVLPLVYDDSLSYYESVCKLVTKVNEVIESIEDLSDDVLREAKAYTDEAIRESQAEVDRKVLELQGIIDSTVAEFDRKLDLLQNQYDAFTRQTNAKITLIDNKVNTFGDKIDADIIGVNARTDLAIQQNNEYIFDIIGKQLLGNIKVRNWFTGELISIQDMFDYLCIEFHAGDSADVAYIVGKQYTVNDMVALNASVTNLVTHGKSLIV